MHRLFISYILYGTALICMLQVSGCSTAGKFGAVMVLRDVSLEKAADKVLADSVKKVCKYPTIGSLERRYGDNPTKYKQYHDYCQNESPKGELDGSLFDTETTP